VLATADGHSTKETPMSADGHCWDDVLGPDERLITKNYEPRRLEGHRPALLMIDVSKNVFGDRPEPVADAIDRWPSTCGLAAWDALGPLEQVLDAARSAGVPIAHTTGEARPEHRLGGATKRREVSAQSVAEGYEIVDSLKPAPGEFVVHKSRASAFFGSVLVAWLVQQQADTVVIAGQSTSGCVRATTVDAFSYGFRTAVVEDAVFDRSPLSHKMSLFDLHLKYAAVVRLRHALDYFSELGARS
jgi:maleamate amidohydrolase